MDTNDFEAIAERKTGELYTHVLWSGHVPASNDQYLYAVEWGNKEGIPFMCLHGGPGDSFRPSHVALFDPAIHHVIFFDQRGCGESTPNAIGCSKEVLQATNTPAHIIKDMEVLREYFGFEKMHLAGGSWGSTLALFYAIAHPERVLSMQLWSLYLATSTETFGIFEDRTANPAFPTMCKEQWKIFIDLVPETERTTPATVVEYYAGPHGANSSDIETAKKYAQSYLAYEYTLCQPDGSDTNPEATLAHIREDVAADPNTLPGARIEMTYIGNDMFVEENHIYTNIEKIKDIPINIVQGKRDWCTPIKYAREFEEKLGKRCVEEVASGHLRSDIEMAAALRRNLRNIAS